MSAVAPNPNSNLLLLAVLGIGAYWVMSRRAMAQPVYVNPGQSSTAARYNLIGQGVNAIGRIFGGMGGSTGQANPIVWDNLSNDGWAGNPSNQSSWNWWATNGTGGD